MSRSLPAPRKAEEERTPSRQGHGALPSSLPLAGRCVSRTSMQGITRKSCTISCSAGIHQCQHPCLGKNSSSASYCMCNVPAGNKKCSAQPLTQTNLQEVKEKILWTHQAPEVCCQCCRPLLQGQSVWPYQPHRQLKRKCALSCTRYVRYKGYGDRCSSACERSNPHCRAGPCCFSQQPAPCRSLRLPCQHARHMKKSVPGKPTVL